jgi:hypothetical protein
MLIGAVSSLLLGCQEHEESIRAYDVPKPALNRILALILPQGEDVWFFKLVGPAEAVAEARPAFLQFVHSVQFPAKGSRISWKSPDGWRVPAYEGSNLLVEVGPASSQLELTVTRLPVAAAAVRANVNRWRGLLGMPALEPDEELDEFAKPLALDAGNATLVELAGPGTGKTRRGGPRAGSPRPGRPASNKFDYTMPEGWERIANVPLSEATFEAKEGGEVVLVTVSPLSGNAGGLLKNVNRWRTEQAGLPAIGEEELDKFVKTFEAGEIHGKIVDVDGPNKRIVAVIAARGKTTWFFKLFGPAEAVGKQQAKFKQFLGSFRFKGE